MATFCQLTRLTDSCSFFAVKRLQQQPFFRTSFLYCYALLVLLSVPDDTAFFPELCDDC